MVKAARKQETTCPNCGYSLEGLSGSRCPECGQTEIAAVRAFQAKILRRVGGVTLVLFVIEVLCLCSTLIPPRVFWRAGGPVFVAGVATGLALLFFIPMGLQYRDRAWKGSILGMFATAMAALPAFVAMPFILLIVRGIIPSDAMEPIMMTEWGRTVSPLGVLIPLLWLFWHIRLCRKLRFHVMGTITLGAWGVFVGGWGYALVVVQVVQLAYAVT